MDKPTLGRIVHYVAYGTPGGEFKPEHRAAIVTEVAEPAGDDALMTQDMVIGICVLNPTGLFFNRGVLYDPSGERGGSWHWPERS